LEAEGEFVFCYNPHRFKVLSGESLAVKRETGEEDDSDACAAPATVSKCGFVDMPLCVSMGR